jgi:hypothetical protein
MYSSVLFGRAKTSGTGGTGGALTFSAGNALGDLLGGSGVNGVGTSDIGGSVVVAIEG